MKRVLSILCLILLFAISANAYKIKSNIYNGISDSSIQIYFNKYSNLAWFPSTNWKDLISRVFLSTVASSGRYNVDSDLIGENELNRNRDNSVNIGPEAYEQLMKTSQNFGTALWVELDATETDNQAIAPDGTPTADEFFDVATDKKHAIYNNFGGADRSLPHTFSCFLKNNDRRYATIGVSSGNAVDIFEVLVDLQAGTVLETNVAGDGAISSYGIKAYVDGWYAVWATGTLTTGFSNIYPIIGMSNRNTYTGAQEANGIQYTGDGSSFYVWGSQLTQTAYPMPYAPNDSAVATKVVPTNSTGADFGTKQTIGDALRDAIDGVADGITLNSGDLVSANKYLVITTEADTFGAGVVAGDRVTGLTTALDANNTVQTILDAQGQLNLTIEPQLAMVNASGLGDEEVTNGDFSAWTGDDPDDWTIFLEDANNYITEHVDGARIVSNNSAAMYINQVVFTTGKKYKITFVKNNHVAGSIRWKNPETAAFENIENSDANGTYTVIITANNTALQIYRDSTGNTDYVLNSVSVQEILPINILTANDESKTFLTHYPYLDELHAVDLDGNTAIVDWVAAVAETDISLQYDSTSGMRLAINGVYGDYETFSGRFPNDADKDLRFGYGNSEWFKLMSKPKWFEEIQ